MRPRSAHVPSRTAAARPRLARRVVLAGLIPLALAAAGCSGSSTTTSTSTTASGAASSSVSASGMPNAFPVTVTGGNGSLTLNAAPEKIVSLSPSLTEDLFAIGAGTQVEAVDDQSTYPPEAPKTKLSGFQPNAEAIAGYKPDLVVLTSDANGVVAALAKLKVPTLVLPAPATLDEAYGQMVTLGEATGHKDDAEKLVTTTKDRVAKAVASAPASAKGKKIYHELDPTYYSVTSSTFIGSVYKQFGLTNIADAAPTAVSTGGYPQLSAEYVVKSAPDYIYLADVQCCQMDAAKLAARAGFANVPAVKNGGVIEGDADIASRWGPRIADFAESVAKSLNATK